jgi:type II secretory pathway component PulF
MAQEVYMDIPQVEKISKSFETFGEILDAVAKTLEAVSAVLKATAWLSLGSTAAVAAFIDRILPNIKRVAAKMKELSSDVTGAIKAYRDGDLSGSRRFV